MENFINIYKILILIKNNKTKTFEDKTSDISYLDNIRSQVKVIYSRSNKTYNYNSFNVRIFKEPKKINLDQKVVLISGFPVRSSSLVLDFGEYIKIINDNQAAEIYHKSEVTYENSCLNSKQPRAVFDYFKKLSSYVNVMEDGKKVLFKQYEKIITVRKDSCCPHI